VRATALAFDDATPTPLHKITLRKRRVPSSQTIVLVAAPAIDEQTTLPRLPNAVAEPVVAHSAPVMVGAVVPVFQHSQSLTSTMAPNSRTDPDAIDVEETVKTAIIKSINI
jgi:hypothetical protein